MNDFRELIRRQIDIEDEAKALGARRYRAGLLPWRDAVGEQDEEANLPPGQQLLRTATLPFAEAIREFIAETNSGKAGRRHSAADLLLLTDPVEAAYLTCRVVLNESVAGAMMQTVATRVADAVIENLEYYAFKEQNKVGYKGFLKAQAAKGYSRQRKAAVKKLFTGEGVAINISLSERINIGLKLIEMLIESTGLFVRDTVARPKGHAYSLRPSETLQHWLDEQHARCEILAPIHMPMIVRPRRWRSPSYGGYLTPRAGNVLVKQRNKAYQQELRNVDMPKVYDSVNHIQETPWRINSRLLAVLEQVWDTGGCLGGLPARENLPVPAKPSDIETNEEAKLQWKKEAASVHAKNAELVSSRVAVHKGLWTARKFLDEREIFYPHEMDFRGRVYPIALFGPSPQGCDWQKALLEFAHGVALGEEGRRWLMIHIANLFGVDNRGNTVVNSSSPANRDSWSGEWLTINTARLELQDAGKVALGHPRHPPGAPHLRQSAKGDGVHRRRPYSHCRSGPAAFGFGDAAPARPHSHRLSRNDHRSRLGMVVLLVVGLFIGLEALKPVWRRQMRA
ncbi:hypothetical protein D5I55_02310 [Chakrabartia godavariana]|nr:hypothetical protein D5I55_02310 [Chakrabartia godavariana]